VVERISSSERDDVGTVISQTLKPRFREDAARGVIESTQNCDRAIRRRWHCDLLFHGMFSMREVRLFKGRRGSSTFKLFENQDATSLDKRTLDPDRFLRTIKYLLKLRKNIGTVDTSITGTPRPRGWRVAGKPVPHRLVRMERAIKEKVGVPECHGDAARLVNAKPRSWQRSANFWIVTAVAFMDQTTRFGDHAQAASFALGPAVCRAKRAGLSPRRSPHALRPHLPD